MMSNMIGDDVYPRYHREYYVDRYHYQNKGAHPPPTVCMSGKDNDESDSSHLNSDQYRCCTVRGDQHPNKTVTLHLDAKQIEAKEGEDTIEDLAQRQGDTKEKSLFRERNSTYTDQDRRIPNATATEGDVFGFAVDDFEFHRNLIPPLEGVGRYVGIVEVNDEEESARRFNN